MRGRIVCVFSLLAFLPFSLGAQESVTLTAEVVRELALGENLEVQAALLDQEIGREALPAALSIYDLTLSADVSHIEDRSQQATVFSGTNTKRTTYNFGLGQKTPLGTGLGLGFRNERDTLNLAPAFSFFDPVYESQVAVELRQPVVNNILGFKTRGEIRVIKKRLEALDHGTQARIQGAVLASLIHYWQFYLASHNLTFEREALGRAQELYQANKKKEDIGLIEESDLHAFAANSNLRESKWLEAQDSLVESEGQVRVDLDLLSASVLKAGKESFENDASFNLGEILSEALSLRSDYLALQREVEASDLQVALKKNSLWPQIDLVATLNLNGMSAHYSGAVENIGDGHPEWVVGMEVNFPLQNRLERSQYRKGQAERARKILEFKQKELEISRQVKERVEKFKNAEARMTATRNARINQYKKMTGELKKYEQGRSDSDTVIRYQNDLIDAKKLALKAEVEYQLSLIQLQYVRGTLLE